MTWPELALLTGRSLLVFAVTDDALACCWLFLLGATVGQERSEKREEMRLGRWPVLLLVVAVAAVCCWLSLSEKREEEGDTEKNEEGGRTVSRRIEWRKERDGEEGREREGDRET